MDLKIVAVGKIKDNNFKTLIADYLKRIQIYVKTTIIEVEDESIAKNSNNTLDSIVKEKEGQRILDKIKEHDYVILLDLLNAKALTSIELSETIEKLMCEGKTTIVFVIGGSLGLGENVRKRGNMRLELSKMTFTHQFVRLIILEQVYRAYKIINNETYHK